MASAPRIPSRRAARPVMVGDRVAAVLLLSRSPRALFRALYEGRGKLRIAGGGIPETPARSGPGG
ncbi:hypothetical protein [Phenylobacterium sp.]|uniref:hypothetical protein n=1 Tax=Phenylobacterium sp. TaxID=1871053 RepID=UPI00391AFD78